MSISIAINANFENQEDAFTFLARLGREFVQEHLAGNDKPASVPASLPKRQTKTETVVETETADEKPQEQPQAPAAKAPIEKKKRGRPAKSKNASPVPETAAEEKQEAPAAKAEDKKREAESAPPKAEIVEGEPDCNAVSDAELRDLVLRFAKATSYERLTAKMGEYGVTVLTALSDAQRPRFADEIRAELAGAA